MNVRATFDLRLAGHPSEVPATTDLLAERLAQAGFSLGDDFGRLHNADGALIGLRLHTADVLRDALDLLPGCGAYLVETDRSSLLS